jgi:hypothetical protein
MKTPPAALLLAVLLLPLFLAPGRAEDALEGSRHEPAEGRHFYGRDHDMARWRQGYWTHGYHEGHEGWWWVVGDVWYLYPVQVSPYPDPYQAPIVIVEPPHHVPPVVLETPQGPEVHFAPSPPPIEVTQTSPTFTDKSGRTCREYQSTVIVNGAPKPAYGTACLQPDGSWRVVH